MFGLFSDKKTALEKNYHRLLKESFEQSHSNRKLSDLKATEAESVRLEIDQLENGKQ